MAKRAFTFNLDDETRMLLETRCKVSGVPMSEIIRRLIKESFAKENTNGPASTNNSK